MTRPSSNSRRNRRRGFTLLEVMVAVMILALTGVAIFRFVRGTLQALSVSVQDTEEQLALERMVALVQEALYGLSPRGTANLKGENLKLDNRNMDKVEWRSRGGPGLMTTAASGEYQVQLRIMPLKENTKKFEIGLWRRPALLDTETGLIPGGSDKDADWVPLLPDVNGLMIRYFDSRLGQLVDKWADPSARPSYVLLSIWRVGDTVPYEAVLTVPAALTQQQ